MCNKSYKNKMDEKNIVNIASTVYKRIRVAFYTIISPYLLDLHIIIIFQKIMKKKLQKNDVNKSSVE
jgi:hypothetical protein